MSNRNMTTEIVESADDGVEIPVDSLEKTYAYNVDGDLETITISYADHSYVKTFTYTAGALTGESVWVRQ